MGRWQLFFLLLVSWTCAVGNTGSAGKTGHPVISEEGVEARDTIYDITTFGAKGDGETDNTPFINRAIEVCSRQGGGTVVIPEGTFLTGSVLLKSKVNLYLRKGAVLKGVPDLSKYVSISEFNKSGDYYMVKPVNWNRALLLGDRVDHLSISGEGMIDGGHVEDKYGEEHMRGPHILFLSRSTDITISGIRLRRASNYAFMSYDIERVSFCDLLIEEGWDGIHIRKGKDIRIRDCRFFTGDDAIAGGLWQDMLIENCRINSSCNGIRVIMPVSGLRISACAFQGPGKYPHRTSGEQRRRNMLSGLLIQPGAWFPAPGEVEDVSVSDCLFDGMDNPFLITMNEGNRGERIRLERIVGTRLGRAAASVESWSGESLRDVRLSDVSLSYTGTGSAELMESPVVRPATDYRPLPCWGLFLRDLDQVVLRDVRLRNEADCSLPAARFDNVESIEMENVDL